MPTKPIGTQELGNLGEQLVCNWLASKHCEVLYRQWHSRFGEIDLIAKGLTGQDNLRCETLAFIEVKTRSQGNWDANGLLALTRSKQAKIRTTARYFLVRHPYLSELPCRFDVALVSCHPGRPEARAERLVLPIPHSRQYLKLQAYLPDAF